MKDHFESIDEILDFAIEREEQASSFYLMLAEQTENPKMKKVLEGFAREEKGHKAKLQSVKDGNAHLLNDKEVQSLGIADYVVSTDPTPDMTYAEVLRLAMEKEKAAYRFYLDLAAVAEAKDYTDLFLELANEEAKHKLRFEIEYDDVVLKDN